MHPTQLEILDSLRQSEVKQFAELLRDVAETSDNLAYHLKQLQKNDFIESLEKGTYTLAQKGIIYLNNNLELQHDLFPTVSCMLELHNAGGEVLVMKKLKQPFLGKLHLPTFGVTSDRTLHLQIQDFMDRYQIAATNIIFKAVHRDRSQGGAAFPVFDKFFMVFRGNLSLYERDIEDRQFLAVPATGLLSSPNVLFATKAVLSLAKGDGYTETTVDDY
jgi:hypothetical protein